MLAATRQPLRASTAGERRASGGTPPASARRASRRSRRPPTRAARTPAARPPWRAGTPSERRRSRASQRRNRSGSPSSRSASRGSWKTATFERSESSSAERGGSSNHSSLYASSEQRTKSCSRARLRELLVEREWCGRPGRVVRVVDPEERDPVPVVRLHPDRAGTRSTPRSGSAPAVRRRRRRHARAPGTRVR